jgi:hypothetical protein
MTCLSPSPNLQLQLLNLLILVICGFFLGQYH